MLDYIVIEIIISRTLQWNLLTFFASVAVNAVIDSDKITVKVMLGYLDGIHIMHKELTSAVIECHLFGEQLADAMIADGALDILSKAEEISFKDEMPERL